MAILQVRLNDELKAQADELFASLGLDTSTAVRIFLTTSLENNGIPFAVKHNSLSSEMKQALYDSRNRVNLTGTFATAEEAVNSMLED